MTLDRGMIITVLNSLCPWTAYAQQGPTSSQARAQTKPMLKYTEEPSSSPLVLDPWELGWFPFPSKNLVERAD